jgi:hypothetical protein
MVRKRKPRTFIRYVEKVGNKVVGGGITERPLEEREAERRRKQPKSHLEKVGPKVTEQTARAWEKKHGYS